MKWFNRSRVTGLALVLTLVVSCTSSDSAPTGPVAAPVEQPSLLSGKNLDGDDELLGTGLEGSTVNGSDGILVATIDLLTCESQPYVVARKTIGPSGGSLTIGRHRLEIPRGALTSKVRITGEQVSGTVNSVRLSPEGLRFAKPARLTLSYGDCASVTLRKRVAYTDELLKLLELPPSQDYPKYEYVTGAIDHFSRYAVAY